ncbi:MAG TPA: HD domain-containing phosphohydrolase [Longimicrobiales bacterium]|nr:HD domain-containing phosphohydrolase [Longimicrobiales bacterium]
METASTATLIAAAKRAEREGDLDTALRGFEAALASLVVGGTPELAADLLRWIGTVRWNRDEAELASEAYEASLALAEAAGDDGRIAAVLNWTGILEQVSGSLEAAEALYRSARQRARSAGDDPLVAMVDQNIATLANIRGDVRQALASYGSALRRLSSLDRPESSARVLNNMGMARVDLEDWGEARRCFDRAYDLADGMRDSMLLATIDLNRAELDLRQGDLASARERCDRAFETYSRIGSDAGRGEAFKLYGAIARQSGKLYLAAAQFDAGLQLARKCGDPLLEAETEAERAIMYLEGEQNAEALRSLNRAHALFSELQARRELFDLDRRLDALEHTYLEVVERWGASIEAKDQYTAGHCERVADYACMIAGAMDYSARDLAWFRMGGFLHDVGKTAVPAEVLNKPGKLTDEEWTVMKSHTTVGYDIVRDLKFPWDIAPLVRSHHERWDGKGYPDGLAGEDIPITARILGVADVYDALTTARSYRSALSHEEAIGIMERDSGTAFDPELFGLFRGLIEERRRMSIPRPPRRSPTSRSATRAAS